MYTKTVYLAGHVQNKLNVILDIKQQDNTLLNVLFIIIFIFRFLLVNFFSLKYKSTLLKH